MYANGERMITPALHRAMGHGQCGTWQQSAWSWFSYSDHPSTRINYLLVIRYLCRPAYQGSCEILSRKQNFQLLINLGVTNGDNPPGNNQQSIGFFSCAGRWLETRVNNIKFLNGGWKNGVEYWLLIFSVCMVHGKFGADSSQMMCVVWGSSCPACWVRRMDQIASLQEKRLWGYSRGAWPHTSDMKVDPRKSLQDEAPRIRSIEFQSARQLVQMQLA